jgi:hypothetical protein
MVIFDNYEWRHVGLYKRSVAGVCRRERQSLIPAYVLEGLTSQKYVVLGDGHIRK